MNYSDVKENCIKEIQDYIRKEYNPKNEEEDFKLYKSNPFYHALCKSVSLLRQLDIFVEAKEIIADKIELLEYRIEEKNKKYNIDSLKSQKKGFEYVLQIINIEDTKLSESNNELHSVEVKLNKKGGVDVQGFTIKGERKLYKSYDKFPEFINLFDIDGVDDN